MDKIMLAMITLSFVLCLLVPLHFAVPVKENEQNLEIALSPSGLNFLRDKGYYSLKSSASGQLLDTAGLAAALKDFQKFANIPVTGKFDSDTKRMMQSPRCGMADKVDKSSSRERRYLLQGTSWQKSKLTWAVENDNNDGITRNQVRYTMQRSFDKWQALTNLEFTELTNSPINSADIRVRFVRGAHEDSYAFDGPGGTLAHAFYPLGNTGLAGDVHFDDDETFSIAAKPPSSQYKLLWVAVHELGHSLGLEHSNIQGAIMYPWYQAFDGDDFDLTEDDRIGIQSIYGSRVGPETPIPPRTTTTTTETPVIPKSQCSNRIGAALYGVDKRTYIYNDNIFYITQTSDQRQNGMENGPLLTKAFFKTIDKVDAVFRRPRDNMIIFFHGAMFSVYNSKELYNDARKISDGFQGLPEGTRDIDAALFDKRSNKLYLFKGKQYWRFSERFNSPDFLMDRNYPQNIAMRWKGLPESIDAALSWESDKVYFFKDDRYYRWDHQRRSVQYGYPQKVSSVFLGCGPNAYQLETNDRTGSSASICSSSILLMLISLSVYIIFLR